MTYASLHHTFDIHLAAKYGIEEAIIIHHFQHWIQVNKKLESNFHEGRTWTYQTLDEIAAHFPYMNRSQVFDILFKLEHGFHRKSKTKEKLFEPVIIKSNFNKTKFDKTVWYAFRDEASFIVLGNPKNDKRTSQNPDWEIPTPIPDTKPDTKPDVDKEPSIKVSKNEDAPKGARLKEFSEEVKELGKYVLSKMKQINPNYKITEKQAEKWMIALDCMIRLDKRTPQQIIDLLEFALNDPFWRDKLFKPNPINYLRQKFDQWTVRMSSIGEQAQQELENSNIRINKHLFYKWKSQYQELEEYYLTAKSVQHKNGNGKDVSLALDPEIFAERLTHLVGQR